MLAMIFSLFCTARLGGSQASRRWRFASLPQGKWPVTVSGARRWIPVACAVLTACGGVEATSASNADASTKSEPTDGPLASLPAEGSVPPDGQGTGRTSLDDAGPVVRPCTMGAAFFLCSGDSGSDCQCISADPTDCPQCGPTTAATCRNLCGPDQYVATCGGPPLPPSRDGAPSDVVYQEPPDACVEVGSNPGGITWSCCPRQ
jgi:hypothetical protein